MTITIELVDAPKDTGGATTRCPSCDRQFVPRQGSHRFCSSRCCQKARRQALGSRKTDQLGQCPYCGVLFSYSGHLRKFCSNKCSRAVEYRRSQGKPEHFETRYCQNCSRKLNNRQRLWCSNRCFFKGSRGVSVFCKGCGVTLPKGRIIWCSADCKERRLAAKRLVERAIERAGLSCKHCSVPLPLESNRTLWCSKECKQANLTRKYAETKCKFCQNPIPKGSLFYCGAECRRKFTLLAAKEDRAARQDKVCDECERPLSGRARKYCPDCRRLVALEDGRDRYGRKGRKHKAKDPRRQGDCHWCGLLESETSRLYRNQITEVDECHTCAQAIRRGACPTCGGPKGQFGCHRCNPVSVKPGRDISTLAFVDITLLNDVDCREKTVRFPVRHGRGLGAGKVRVYKYRLVPRDGLAVEVPLKYWLKYR